MGLPDRGQHLPRLPPDRACGKRVFDVDGEIQIGEIPDHGTCSSPMDGRVRQLYAGIHQLPPLERTLISLYLDEVSTKEMAEILGISEVNTRVKLHRIKKTLKQLVENDHGTE